MTSDERDRMLDLCRRIQNEDDRRRFGELVRELNDFLGQIARQSPQD